MDYELNWTCGPLILAETIREGLDCVVALLQDDEYADSANVLEEAIQGIAAIEGALYPQLPDKSRDSMSAYSLELHHAVAAAQSYFASGHWELLEQLCRDCLLPRYETWLNELYRLLARHCYC
ncbi:MAG: hypothetical protein ACOX0F_02000 [Syntrophomonadaceae bacterium]|jgi:hypothetical protein